MSIIRNIITVLALVVLIVVGFWIAGFHIETYDFLGQSYVTLWHHSDILYYWEW